MLDSIVAASLFCCSRRHLRNRRSFLDNRRRFVFLLSEASSDGAVVETDGAVNATFDLTAASEGAISHLLTDAELQFAAVVDALDCGVNESANERPGKSDFDRRCEVVKVDVVAVVEIGVDEKLEAVCAEADSDDDVKEEEAVDEVVAKVEAVDEATTTEAVDEAVEYLPRIA